MTKDSWEPDRPLAWGDLEEPFLTVTNPPQRGSSGTNEGHYYFSGNLPWVSPAGTSFYFRWVRSDSQENFFGCSDVTFDGGNGQVTGVGTGGPTLPPTTTPAPPTTTPPPTSTPPPTTTPPPVTTPTPPLPGGDCMAVYRVVSTWNGGFQGEVTIMNHRPPDVRRLGGELDVAQRPAAEPGVERHHVDQRVDGARHQRQLQRQHRAER